MEKLKANLNKQKQKSHDYLAKIVIIGDSSVGKTNILLRFVSEHYSVCHVPTIGVDFKSKIVEVPSNGKNNKMEKKKIKLQLWDTAGQQRFRTITQTYYKGASGIVVVYSIGDRKTFNSVTDWLYQIEQNNGQNLPKILVGNKCDLKLERTVSFEEGRILADENKCAFMEVSAKENINIDQLFTQLALSINVNFQKENNKLPGVWQEDNSTHPDQRDKTKRQDDNQCLQVGGKSHNIVLNDNVKKGGKQKGDCCG